MGKELISSPTPSESGDKKTKIKQQQYTKVSETYRIIRFKGGTLIEENQKFVPLTSDTFARCFYQIFPHASIQQIKEVEHKVRNHSPDYSHLDHLIDFGGYVWNTRTLEFETTQPPTVVLRSPLSPDPASRKKALAYLLQLADQNEELAWDMLQGLAPLFMDKKPAGVIWFVGGGANGKSALINAVYKIIGDHLASMTVSRIEDGRDTPRLNGVIGNVCRESSEGRVEDTERYKAIGTHEPFEVHKFHSQDSIDIQTNFHTVFNANNIPIFSDKTEGARRRTLIVPFPAKFKDDPTFEERTFTKQFLGGLISLILDATHMIADNKYQYKFSLATMGAKSEYDSEVNSAEAFLTHLRDNKVKAFTNYNLLRIAYENWCADYGFVPLGMTSLKRVMTQIAKVQSHVFREDGVTKRWYFIDKANPKQVEYLNMQSLSNGIHVGLKVDEEDAPEPTPISEDQQSQLGKDW